MLSDTSGRRTGQARSGVVAAMAAAFAICMAGTTLPTPLYEIYSARFGFRTLTVTILFAVYAIGVVVTLTLLGRLSDAVGRQPVMLGAVAISIAGSLVLAAASGLTVLLLGRVISGLAAGLMSGTGTAAIVDQFRPARRGAAGTIAVAANTGGLALGTLMAGILAEVAPQPLVTPYLVQVGLAVLAGLVLLLVGRSGSDDRSLRSARRADAAHVRSEPQPTAGDAARPQTTQSQTPGFQTTRSRPASRLRPGRLRVPSEIRGSFWRAVLAGGAGFAVTGVLTSVSSLFLATVLNAHSHALAGGVVALVFAFMAVGQLMAGRAQPHAAMLAGCVGLCLAAGILLCALVVHSLAALLIAAVVLGVAGGTCLNAGIASTVERVRSAQRGEVSSSYFAGLYVLLALPVIGVGVLAAHTSLISAGVVFCIVVMALAAGIAVVEVRTRRRTSGSTPGGL